MHIIYPVGTFNYFATVLEPILLNYVGSEHKLLFIANCKQHEELYKKHELNYIVNKQSDVMKPWQMTKAADDMLNYIECIDSVTVMMGHSFLDIKTELSGYARMRAWQLSTNECKEWFSVKQHIETIYLYTFLNSITESKKMSPNFVIHNFLHDPMSIKLVANPNVNQYVRHYYFHLMNNGFATYKQAYEIYNAAQLLEFDFELTSIMHSYLTKNIHDANNERQYISMFGMTDAFDTLFDRTKIVRQIVDLSNAVDRTKHRHMVSSSKIAVPAENKGVEYDEYCELLSNSMSTLVIPSYDVRCFSVIRFVEAIKHGCVPFVLHTCQYEHVFTQDLVDIIKKHLLVADVSDLIAKSESLHRTKNASTLINLILNTQYFKDLIAYTNEDALKYLSSKY